MMDTTFTNMLFVWIFGSAVKEFVCLVWMIRKKNMCVCLEKARNKCHTLKVQQKGSTPTPWARGLRDQIPKSALQSPDPENPLFLGFCVLRGGLRPWSRKGARPWGRGRSRDCEK